MKLKNFLSAGLLLVSLSMQASITHLIVELKNDSKYSFLLADSPVITFQSGDLVVNGNATTSYAISDVKNYHFGEGIQSDNQLLNSNELLVSYVDENTIKVQNASANAQVLVFNVAGAAVSNQTVDSEGVATVQLPTQAGVYVVKVGDKSFKVIRK